MKLPVNLVQVGVETVVQQAAAVNVKEVVDAAARVVVKGLARTIVAEVAKEAVKAAVKQGAPEVVQILVQGVVRMDALVAVMEVAGILVLMKVQSMQTPLTVDFT